jgi:hypothetical protein
MRNIDEKKRNYMTILGCLRGKWKLALPLVIASAVGLAYQGQAHANAPLGPVPNFTATQLANAVLFDNGPAAPYIASLNRPAPKQDDTQIREEQAIDTAISADRVMAANFQTEIQSGDPNQVKGALSQLSRVTYTVYVNLFGSAEVSQAVAYAQAGVAANGLIQGVATDNELANYSGDDNYRWTNNYLALDTAIALDKIAVAVLVFFFDQPDNPVVGVVQDTVIANIASNLQARTATS